MDVQRFLHHLQRLPGYKGQLVHVEELPPRPPRCGELDPPLPPALQRALAARGIGALYTHQVRAIELLRRGQHTVITTGTASGKSLCYHLPVLERLLEEPQATALYLFPTKALAQDQLKGILRLLEALPELAASVQPGVYDGDTPRGQRRTIRQQSRLVLSNPDMLHAALLPYHPNWARFFAQLRYVVLDEAHTYRGIFGAHVAQVLRRLRRITDAYGSRPVFVATSATIANPSQLLEQLVGEPFQVVTEDGSPRGRKFFAFWNPPPAGSGRPWRRSAVDEAVALMIRAMEQGAQVLTFARTRQQAELVFRYVQEYFRRQGSPLAEQVQAYRGGYLPEQRRQIEADLFQGRLRGLAATNALELGIDVGGLDMVIMLGYPGTIASCWQQAGRAGRPAGPGATGSFRSEAGNSPGAEAPSRPRSQRAVGPPATGSFRSGAGNSPGAEAPSRPRSQRAVGPPATGSFRSEAGNSPGAEAGATFAQLPAQAEEPSLFAAMQADYPFLFRQGNFPAGESDGAGGESLAVLIAGNDPVDQFLMRHPEYFFGRSPEHAVADPHNPYVVRRHLAVAAQERPLEEQNAGFFGPQWQQHAQWLQQQGLLLSRAGRFYYQGPVGPAQGVSLRHLSDETFTVVLLPPGAAVPESAGAKRAVWDALLGRPAAGEQVLATVDGFSAPELIYPEAIYLHQGNTYLVRHLDWEGKLAYVEPVQSDYYTQAIVEKAVFVQHAHLERFAAPGHRAGWGSVEVRWKTTAFKKIRFHTRENVGWGSVALPQQQLQTKALWLVPQWHGGSGTELAEALAGLCNLATTAAPLVTMSDTTDLGGVVDFQNFGRGTVILYDRYPGGLGYCERAFACLEQLLQMCRQLLEECPCRDGCPACVGVPQWQPSQATDPDLTSSGPMPDKEKTGMLLEQLLQNPWSAPAAEPAAVQV